MMHGKEMSIERLSDGSYLVSEWNGSGWLKINVTSVDALQKRVKQLFGNKE